MATDTNYLQMHERPRALKTMPCGGTPIADMGSSIGAYMCDVCFAVIGSIGQPQSCKDMNERGHSNE